MNSIKIFFITATAIWSMTLGLGTDERFIKKYAMMKVYESCYGPQVLKEIRGEMKDAAQKCAGIHMQYDASDKLNYNPKPAGEWNLHDTNHKARPSSAGTKVKKPIHTTDTLLLQQWSDEQKEDASTLVEQDPIDTESQGPVETENQTPYNKKPIDLSKLEETIMNFGRPMNSFAVPKPTSLSSKYPQPSSGSGYFPPMYYHPPLPFPPSFHGYHPYYPGFYQSPGPVGGVPFNPFLRNGLRGAKVTNFNVRWGKQLDLPTQIDSTSFQFGSKIRNISCIMQELGYLNDRLEPNYFKINERIRKLQIDEELKRDMLDSVQFCRQFSQCVPEERQDSFHFSKELLRPMLFFKCYKQKKLESCIMKDIRERVSQTSAEINNEVKRSFDGNDFNPILDSILGASGDDFASFLF